MQASAISASSFARDFNFEDIRPYYDNEARPVLQRLVKDPVFFKLVNYLWPEMTMKNILSKADKVHSNLDFQMEFMHKAIRTIVERTSDGLTCSGFEHLDKNTAYLFVANHRDILLDSAILQILLVEHGFSTSEITFGSNLMEKGFITDFGKLNRMFVLQREGTNKELYEISRKLSAYIRHTIVDKNTSVWIAQRNGRTKDGNDVTQTGLLKMLNISGPYDNTVDNFKQLKIVPLSISYEYEPCDGLKARESYLSSLHSVYKKAPGEDLNSITTGITQYKGRIHLSVGKPLTDELNDLKKIENENEKIKQLTSFIDGQLYKQYKLFPTNYIASDWIQNSDHNSHQYSLVEKNKFTQHIKGVLNNLQSEIKDTETLQNILLKQYAAPVQNVESK